MIFGFRRIDGPSIAVAYPYLAEELVVENMWRLPEILVL